MTNPQTESLNWLPLLSHELGTEEDELIHEMLAFRSECSNSLLRGTYPDPRTIREFGKRKSLYKGSVDFVLTFLDARYPSFATTIATECVGKIAANTNDHKLFATRMLDVENYRRSAYWKDKFGVLSKNIFGWYYVSRKTTRGQFEREVLFLSANKALTQVVDGYWLRQTDSGTKTCLGNFFAAESSLIGTFVRASSDSLIHPIHMTIGYSATGKNPIEITTGFLSGSKVEDGSIFHYPFAIFGHERSDENFQDHREFEKLALAHLTDTDNSSLFEAIEKMVEGVQVTSTDRDAMKLRL